MITLFLFKQDKGRLLSMTPALRVEWDGKPEFHQTGRVFCHGSCLGFYTWGEAYFQNFIIVDSFSVAERGVDTRLMPSFN